MTKMNWDRKYPVRPESDQPVVTVPRRAKPWRLITLKFASQCAVCGEKFAAGECAYWYFEAKEALCALHHRERDLGQLAIRQPRRKR